MSKRSVPQESDIIIHPDGRISVSFLWSDLVNDGSSSRLSTTKSEELYIHPHAGDVHRSNVACDDASLLQEYSACKLCPRECGFDRVAQRHPRCGDTELRVGTWGISMGDEPEIRGDRGSGVIMLSGCPLKCPSCHNPEMVQNGQAVSMNEFLNLCYELRAKGAENIQILSPTVHFPKLRVILETLRADGFDQPIIMKSSGFENVRELRKLEGLVDLYLPDLKFGSCSAYARRAGVADYFSVAKEALSEMHRQTGDYKTNDRGFAQSGVFVRHVMAPLPPVERSEVLGYLESLKPRYGVSILDNFTVLE